MSFEFRTPAISQEDVEEAVAKSGPRALAPKGNYKVRLHSITGRSYEKDGQTRDLAKLFFINLEGNYKGAELTLFRVGGDQATTTNKEAVIAIGLAAGLTNEQVASLNWAIDVTNPVDDRGNVAAAFGTSATGPLKIEGLELMAYVEIEEGTNGYKRNIVKNLKLVS